MSADSMLTLSHIAIAFGLIVAALGGYGQFYYGEKIRNEKQCAVAEFRIRTPDYVGGLATKPLMNLCGSDYEITFRKGEDRVLVSAQVTSIDGKVVAEIKDNEWKINPNNYFKRTYSDRDLEVTDNFNLPILQVKMIDESTVALRGVFISKTMVVVAIENGTSIMGGSPSLDKIRDALQNLPRLFQEKPE